MAAARASKCLLFFFLLSFLSACSSSGSLPSGTMSFIRLRKVLDADRQVLSTLSNSAESAYVYLDQGLVESFTSSKASAISWLKHHIKASPLHVNIRGIVICGNHYDLLGRNGWTKLISDVKLVHSIVRSSQFGNEFEVSVMFPLSFLEGLSKAHGNDLKMVSGVLKRIGSFIVVEADIDGEVSKKEVIVQSVMTKVKLATSLLSQNVIPMVLTIKTHASLGEAEVSKFTDMILENSSELGGQIAELNFRMSSMEEFGQKKYNRQELQIIPSSRRELLTSVKRALDDTTYPPTATFPTTASITISPNNPTPTIVTVPGATPVPISPYPDATPVPIPSATPVTTTGNSPLSLTNPVTTPAPITVPGAQPVTNPVNTYPAPAVGNVPVTPPTTTNAPAIPGQSWCVANQGASQTGLQAGLDFACGMGGADCSLIQQGAGCYNPNTLQNHASYAFNSYYQKNPTPTSCDFGGTAMIVNTNPSTGSCVYPLSGSSSVPTTPTPTTPVTPTPIPTNVTPTNPANPTTPITPINPTMMPPATPSGGTGISGNGSPPSVLNSSSPGSSTTTSGYGYGVPPTNTVSASMSTGLQPFIGCIILVISIVTRIIIFEI